MDKTERLIIPNKTEEKFVIKLQAACRTWRVKELVKKAKQVQNRIQSGRNYGELELIKQKIDKQIDDWFKSSLHRLANKKQQELNQAFFQKLAPGVSIPAGILVVGILVSWWWRFKWWVKLMNWWNKPLSDWMVEKDSEEK